MKSLFLLSILLFFTSSPVSAVAPDAVLPTDASSSVWRAGVAVADITPERPVWLSGYSSRNRPSDGVLLDITAKALALEDEQGNRGLIVTAEIRNFPLNLSDRIRDRLQERYGLSRGEIILNGSHTHSGPLMYSEMNRPYYLSQLNAEQEEAVRAYSEWFVERIVRLAGEALEGMEPAKVYADNGVARFAVNRRNNDESRIEELTEFAGPVDHSVPVLRVNRLDGSLLAVAFGYACHPTVLDGYEISGDYPGFAMQAVEEEYPGAAALFFLGAAGDQNPLPRRSVELARQYGRSLAAAVSRVLNEPMRPLEAGLEVRYAEIPLPMQPLPSREELREVAEREEGGRREWARWLMARLDRGEELPGFYPYPVQTWRIGDLPLFSLGGELVVEYAIRLKQLFGSEAVVMGYSNDVMSYIPTDRILEEGGYEGDDSQWVRGLPAHWKPEIEELILGEAARQAESLGFRPR